MKPKIKIFIGNTIWMLLENIIRLSSGLLVGVWMARYLGPEDFGVFTYVIVLSSIFGILAKLGLDTILVKEFITWVDKRDALIGTAFWLKFCGGVISIIILNLLASIINLNKEVMNLIFLFSLSFIFQSVDVLDFYYQSLSKIKVIVLCKIFQVVFSSLIKIYLILNKYQLIYFIIVSLVDYIVMFFLYCFVYYRHNGLSFFCFFDKEIAKDMIKKAWPLFLSSIVVIIYMRIDQILVKWILGEYQLGIYSTAVRLSEIFYILPTILSISIFPLIVRNKENRLVYQLLIRKIYIFVILISVFFGVFMSVLGEHVVNLLFGEQFSDASQVLKVHAWAGIFVSLTMISGKVLIIEGHQHKILYRNILGLIISIVIGPGLISNFNIVGAAYTIFISWFFVGFIYDFLDKSQYQMGIMKIESFLGRVK